MSGVYRYQDQVVDESSPRWLELLKHAHSNKGRLECLCRSEQQPLHMYVSRVGELFVLKRMPFTGAAHAQGCDHYEPPPELSGYGQVVGSAVRDDIDSNTTSLSVDFALTKGASRNMPSANLAEHAEVRADSNKLTMRALLHYLYDEAKLTRWSPRMSGKRSWFVVRRELLAAAAGKRTKGKELGELLFLPETFYADRAAEIGARRVHALERVTSRGSNRMIVVAPLKELRRSRFGFHMVLKHLPDMPFFLNEQMHTQLISRFSKELAIWDAMTTTEVLVIATFSRPQPGAFSVEAASLVNVDENWLPFEGANDLALVSQLVGQGRRFSKGLRYNLSSQQPLAAAVLQDTANPVALFVSPAESDGQYEVALAELLETTGLDVWHWSASDEVMPTLPAVCSGVAQAERMPLPDPALCVPN